ncbi:hypothetical protein RSAG8_01563, partial [Rhizoctonia solani AG-8 WAC10335]
MAHPAPRSSTSVSPASSIDDGRSEISYDSEEGQRLAQQEWDESVQQLQLLLTVVVFPFFGKWLGRKWSHTREYRYLAGTTLLQLVDSFRAVSDFGAWQTLLGTLMYLRNASSPQHLYFQDLNIVAVNLFFAQLRV